MKAFMLLGILVTVASGFYVYARQTQKIAESMGGGSSASVIDVFGARTDLQVFASAERQAYALDGRYLTIEELREKKYKVPDDTRGGYTYSAEISPETFRIWATLYGPDGAEQSSLSIGPDMKIEGLQGAEQ